MADQHCEQEYAVIEDSLVTVSAEIPRVVKDLAATCGREDCYDHVGPVAIPSHQAVVDIVNQARRILFPGYFTPQKIDPVALEYYLGQEMTDLYSALARQIVLAISHDCQRLGQTCTKCAGRGREAALGFVRRLPELRRILAMDVDAALDGDPAAASADEVVFSYPGLYAVIVHRLARVLYDLDVPLLPRIMSEHAHGKTGIDIHPGARIGERFFIDHGTGVVVGQTTDIGDRVRLYQGVTLGALSVPPDKVEQLRRQKRHPTIEDDVIIYSGATILGGNTVIGARSIIGGNVWLTESVPPDTTVLLKSPELDYRGNNSAASKRRQGG
jgi:serine O-acetyltransferase